MEQTRAKRSLAGINRSLSADFVWPKNFGDGTRTVRADRNATHAGSTKDPELQPASSRVIARNNELLSSRGAESKRSSNDLQKQRRILETEKKRHELEMLKRKQVLFELESRQKEIENSLRLQDMEEELEEAEFEAQNSESAICVTRKTKFFEHYREVDEMNDNHVANWINNIPEESELDDFECSPRKDTNNDIHMLCNTLQEVLMTFKSSGQPRTTSYKMEARQSVDKDFPCFDGNPQDWPLFYKHFTNICKLCEYSNEEIMLKLQKCLKGLAKSTVSGMMLISNVDLVMKTLETRFGRPEFIIETLVMKIKNIPFIKDCNLEKLIHLSNEVNNMVSTMKILESTDHLQNPQLMKELLNKLPDILKLNWGEVVCRKNGIVNLDDFAKWLEGYASAACFVSTPQPFEIEKQNQPKSSERYLSTTETPKLKIVQKYCSYCGSDNHQNECPDMKADDIDTRWKTIKKSSVETGKCVESLAVNCFTTVFSIKKKPFLQVKVLRQIRKLK